MMVACDCATTGRGPYCDHADRHDIRTMTQRSERWLIVGACVVLYALAMGFVTWAIRGPTAWLIDTLNARVGTGWAAVILAIPPLAAGLWAMWPDADYTPPVPPEGPLWARVIGNAYLVVLGLSLVVVFAAIFRAG